MCVVCVCVCVCVCACVCVCVFVCVCVCSSVCAHGQLPRPWLAAHKLSCKLRALILVDCVQSSCAVSTVSCCICFIRPFVRTNSEVCVVAA